MHRDGPIRLSLLLIETIQIPSLTITMATADPSQSIMAGSSQKTARGQSPPAQSKRERKKQLIYDKLAALERDMSRDRDRSYREELQKIQADVHLVSRVDPYSDRPLDEIDHELQELSQATANGSDRPSRTLLEMAGPSFQEWVEHVKDMLEVRDYELTSQKVITTHPLHAPCLRLWAKSNCL